MKRLTVKCVLVGDGAVGKMSIASTYVTGQFPDVSIPVVYEVLPTTVTVGAKQVSLNLEVTAGQEDYDRLRSVTYDGADIFMVCFSVVSPTSKRNVSHKWVQEIRRFSSAVPLVLVGLKVDLRLDEAEIQRLKNRNLHPVTNEEGNQLATEIGAKAYLECSAKTGENVRQTIEEVARLASGDEISTNRDERQTSSKNKCVLS